MALGLAVLPASPRQPTASSVGLAGHALFHLWEVAVGICAPSAIARDFPAVTLLAFIGAALTLWAIRQDVRQAGSQAPERGFAALTAARDTSYPEPLCSASILQPPPV